MAEAPEWADRLPQWRSHKLVRAAPIRSFGERDGDGEHLWLGVGGGMEVRAWVAERVFARGRPQQGDYLVVYDDGYVSWSPKQAFEEGYAASPIL